MIIFRVSTENSFGFGHFARLSAVRLFLKEPVHWFVDKNCSKSIKLKIPKEDKITEEINNITSEKTIRMAKLYSSVVVCDSYNLDIMELEASCVRVIIFTDKNIKLKSDNIITINFQPNLENIKFDISGLKYYPIKAKLKKQKKINFSALSKPINLLISFGNVDSANLTAQVLSSILLDKDLKRLLRPICILGSRFKFKKDITILLDKFKHFEIITECDSILNLTKLYPLGVGAPGVSHIERLFMGVATLLLPQTKLHQKFCLEWQTLKCGLYSTTKYFDINNNLKKLISNNFQLAEELSCNGQKLIDGNGAKRLANYIENFIEMKI